MQYLKIVLTVIAMLLSVIAWNLTSQSGGYNLVSPAYAAQTSNEWVFFPVGNQEVRRLVIWDKKTNNVYEYDTRGNLDETWTITAPGEKIIKK